MRRCRVCKQDKPESEFAWRSKAKGTRATCCRARQKIASDAWYEANSDRQIASVTSNNRLYRLQARALVLEAKNVPCADCGVSYPHYVMDFDHVRGRKIANVSRIANGTATASLERLKEEIAKCDVVCSNCHRERSYVRQFGNNASVAQLDRARAL